MMNSDPSILRRAYFIRRMMRGLLFSKRWNYTLTQWNGYRHFSGISLVKQQVLIAVADVHGKIVKRFIVQGINNPLDVADLTLVITLLPGTRIG